MSPLALELTKLAILTGLILVGAVGTIIGLRRVLL